MIEVGPTGGVEDIEELKLRANIQLRDDVMAALLPVVTMAIGSLDWEDADKAPYDCSCCSYYPDGTISLDLFLDVGVEGEIIESIYETISVHEEYGVFR